MGCLLWMYGKATERTADHREITIGSMTCGALCGFPCAELNPGLVFEPLDYERGILRPEADAVAQRGSDLGGTCRVWHVIQVAFGVGFLQVDGGRQKTAID